MEVKGTVAKGGVKMLVEIDIKQDKTMACEGDIAVIEGTPYLVLRVPVGSKYYALQNFNGSSCWSMFDTLQELNREIANMNGEIYKREAWKLLLVAK